MSCFTFLWWTRFFLKVMVKRVKTFYANVPQKWDSLLSNSSDSTWWRSSNLLFADSRLIIQQTLSSHFHSLRVNFSIKSSNLNGALYCRVASCYLTCCLSTWLKAIRNAVTSQFFLATTSGRCSCLESGPPHTSPVVWEDWKKSHLMIINSKVLTE